MRRITGAAGTTGEAAKSTAPRSDSGYQARITSKIKSTTSYLGNTDVPGNPRVEFRIEELPTGEILSVKKIKSSGVPAFDDAVERGINKASPLPKKDNGTVERTLDIGFSMKDLN
jgi:colicin import membrane protein